MSIRPTPGFEAELRVSPVLVAAALVASGAALTLVGLLLSLPVSVLLFALLLYGLAALIWALDHFAPFVARWFTLLALSIAAALAHGWLAVPGALAFMAVPSAVGVAVIGVEAGTGLAAVQSLVFLLLATSRIGGIEADSLITPLVLTSAMLGVLAAVYGGAEHLARWSWLQTRRAQELLEEARDRRAELRQALDDLARANQQLTRLNALAQGLRQMAEEARAAKEQFVANVSHELRTPLNMIVGFSEMIMEASASYGDIPPALLADLTVIQRNSQHLSSLIDDVLELSQIDAGRVALTKEHVLLPEIVESAAVAVRPLYESKDLYLTVDVPVGLQLFCDRTRIREVFLNLLINAGRFTQRGGVHVDVQDRGSDMLVSVADTGPGIADDDQARLFQPFQQLDGSIRRRHGGTGLGLSISKSFVELHGGRMWVESQKGQGATFFFQLPREPSPPLEGSASRWLTPSWEHLQRTQRPLLPTVPLRRRLVVVEKGRSLQRLLTRHLDETEIAPVSGLDEAAEELSRVPAQALLINAPSVSEALQELESSGTLPSATPAIICSVPGPYEAARTLGAFDYLVKPVARDALLATLDRLQLSGKTVLIVDDEPDAQRLFRRMLVSAGGGYRVLRAMDGRQAINILRQQRPDVVLLDLVMPGMDGFQFLAEKRADHLLRDIPVVLISARDPAGQPIVTSALAAMRRGGLSMHELLKAIETLSETLSPPGLTADRAPTETLTG